MSIILNVVITIITIIRLLDEQNFYLINNQIYNKIVYRLSLKYIGW